MHPLIHFSEAVCQSGVSCSGNGFSGDGKLDIVGVAVEVETTMTYDVTKGALVEDEQESTVLMKVECAGLRMHC